MKVQPGHSDPKCIPLEVSAGTGVHSCSCPPSAHPPQHLDPQTAARISWTSPYTGSPLHRYPTPPTVVSVLFLNIFLWYWGQLLVFQPVKAIQSLLQESYNKVSTNFIDQQITRTKMQTDFSGLLHDAISISNHKAQNHRVTDEWGLVKKIWKPEWDTPGATRKLIRNLPQDTQFHSQYLNYWLPKHKSRAPPFTPAHLRKTGNKKILTLRQRKSTRTDTQCDTEKTKHPLKSSDNNVQSNGQPFKTQLFCRVHWALIPAPKWSTLF